jgi:hypothetical protein
MKTVIDKIEAHPPHAFSPPELRAFLRLLPAELLRDVAMVRLSSAMEHSASVHVARFSRLERRLVIVSRSVSRETAMLEVMRCLIRSNSSRPASYGCGPIALPSAKVDSFAKELFSRLAPRMPDAPHWSRVHLKYVPLRRPQTA